MGNMGCGIYNGNQPPIIQIIHITQGVLLHSCKKYTRPSGWPGDHPVSPRDYLGGLWYLLWWFPHLELWIPFIVTCHIFIWIFGLGIFFDFILERNVHPNHPVEFYSILKAKTHRAYPSTFCSSIECNLLYYLMRLIQGGPEIRLLDPG